MAKKNYYFYEYLDDWLDEHRLEIQPTTYNGYYRLVKFQIQPYFKEKKLKLTSVSGMDITKYYAYLSEKGVKNNTILKHHSVLYMALKQAYLNKLIPQNICLDIKRPKKDPFLPAFYSVEEINHLLEVASKNKKLITPVMIACLLGLRRSEIVGLKWDAIDLEKGLLYVKRKAYEDKRTNKICIVNVLKNKSSYRCLPLPDSLQDYLIKLREEQNNNKELPHYNQKYYDCVCVDELGNIVSPNYITIHFRKLLQNNNLKRIRFHDLRHSCASMMLALDCNMKEIQEWLGHSNYSTTANIYAHLDLKAKYRVADKISSAVTIK